MPQLENKLLRMAQRPWGFAPTPHLLFDILRPWDSVPTPCALFEKSAAKTLDKNTICHSVSLPRNLLSLFPYANLRPWGFAPTPHLLFEKSKAKTLAKKYNLSFQGFAEKFFYNSFPNQTKKAALVSGSGRLFSFTGL
jgi:hypothetical protein